jgi:hypothetical protein
MSQIACPYCYHRIDSNRLWFQCTGRGAAGRPGCTPVVDEARVAETGFNEPVRRVFAPPYGIKNRKAACPQCYAISGIRACSCCHTTLSANFGGSNSPLIAMVGAKGTGKTVYLTVLANALRSTLRRRFSAAVQISGDGRGGVGSPLLWLETNVKQLFTHHELAAATAPTLSGRRDPLVFEWRQERTVAGFISRYRTSFLSFYDTAGEDLSSQQSAHDQAYIGAADALILLLDPFMLPQARERIHLPTSAILSDEGTIDVVSRLTEQLRASHSVNPVKKIQIPVAVAFAKIDAFFDLLGDDHPLVRSTSPLHGAYDEADGEMVHEQVRSLLHEWSADDIDIHMSYNYSHFRYFAVSALGHQPDYDTATIRDGVYPHRVEDPLVWLLSQFNVVARQG